jgi:hypothetical protein
MVSGPVAKMTDIGSRHNFLKVRPPAPIRTFYLLSQGIAETEPHGFGPDSSAPGWKMDFLFFFSPGLGP